VVARRIDVIVVYKVDRLTRSLANGGASPNHFFNGRYLRDNLTGLSLGSLAA
jgi:hypothetical protein